MEGAADKRDMARVSDACRVAYRSIDGSSPAERKIAARTLNLSASGVCLVAEDALQPDRHVALEMILSDRDAPVVAVGRVVWCDRDGDQFRIGVCFTWLREEDRKDLGIIGDYVARMLARDQSGD